jgi:hypothetical protein
MPSSSAALGYPRMTGGHSTGTQHLVLLGYALKRIRCWDQPKSKDDLDYDGAWLEWLSQSLHPSTHKRIEKQDFAQLFRQPWDVLEKTLPGATKFLQAYLQEGVAYVLDKIEHLPILPIAADEKGMKTRYPTCSLTAANMVQQILRRVIDHVMKMDPRFSASLGGDRFMDLCGELGDWYSQDCTAATDLHAQWITQRVYEVLCEYDPRLLKYRKWFDKLFGTKKILPDRDPTEFMPTDLLRGYPRAPLLDDVPILEMGINPRSRKYGHASIIKDFFDDWIAMLNQTTGVLTSTGQMMGDPTSFPPLMLCSLFSAEQTLKEFPYSAKERGWKYHKHLRRSDVVMEGVGDDAKKPRWPRNRMLAYNRHLERMGGVLSLPKCFWHPTRAIIAEIPSQAGFPIPFFSTSVLVAPPGGSKGQITWASQSAAIEGDPGIPRIQFPKFLWRMSPYYYTWRLAEKFGLPISAPAAYGGVDVPLGPHRSTTHHTAWLQYLSQQDVVSLIIGLGLSVSKPTSTSFIDGAARDWLRSLMRSNQELIAARITPILTSMSLSEDAVRFLSLQDGYRASLGKIRSAEFYFRAPIENTFLHTPSVRRSAQKFQRTVSRRQPHTKVMGYGATVADLERKTSLFFQSPGGYLPPPGVRPVTTSYGLEDSGIVRVRWKAPHLLGVG